MGCRGSEVEGFRSLGFGVQGVAVLGVEGDGRFLRTFCKDFCFARALELRWGSVCGFCKAALILVQILVGCLCLCVFCCWTSRIFGFRVLGLRV